MGGHRDLPHSPAYFEALRAVFPRAPGEGNPNDNLTLFDFAGRALPGMAAFASGRHHHR